MSFPTPQEYNEAIQNPGASFRDADLRSASVETTPLGLPRPITGNFASVYRLRLGTRSWAVRCFWREIPDLQARYAAISRHLKHASLPYTVGFDYLPDGIRVGGHWYPILKMEWVEGPLLHQYVEENLSSPGTLSQLADRWLRMARLLEASSVAHGDLQHGNVVVRGGDLKLVDYDGMFVPALQGNLNHELGHPNYQHPLRNGSHFGPTLDRFSVWVVYVSLLALSWRPDLWKDMNGGDECLLLRRGDFEKPEASRLFAILHSSAPSPLSHLATRLKELGADSLSCVPELRVPTQGRRTRGSVALDRSKLHGQSGSPASTAHDQARLPDWLHDYLPAENTREAATGRGFLLARAALVTVTLGVVLAFIATLHPLQSVIPVTTIDAAVTALAFLCLIVDFRRSTRVRELNEVRLRRVRASLGHRRVTIQIHRLARRAKRIDTRLQAVENCGSEDLRILDSWKQRREGEVSAAVAVIRPVLNRDVLYLLQGQQEEKRRVLESVRTRHLRTSLSGQKVLTCRIEGLDARSKLVLWCRGVRTAADVDAHQAALSTLPPHATKAIRTWHSELERQAWRSAPDRLPRTIEDSIDRRYARPLRAVRAYSGTVERWESMAEHEIETFYVGEKARLEARLMQRRTWCMEQRDDVERLLQPLMLRRAQYRDEMVELREEVLLRQTDTFPRYTLRLLGFR